MVLYTFMLFLLQDWAKGSPKVWFSYLIVIRLRNVYVLNIV